MIVSDPADVRAAFDDPSFQVPTAPRPRACPGREHALAIVAGVLDAAVGSA